MEDHSSVTRAQIVNLRKRIHLTKNMQVFGIAGLLMCVVTVFIIYIGWQTLAKYAFAAAVVFLIISLVISLWEILISAKSLEIYLADMDKEENA